MLSGVRGKAGAPERLLKSVRFKAVAPERLLQCDYF
jgi:hypothetical protein